MKMHKLILALAFVAASIPVSAQPAQPYSPPDAEIWGLMTRALQDLPMSFATHQQVQQILANVQQESRMRELRAQSSKPTTDEKLPAR